jgi:hypothetical protein
MTYASRFLSLVKPGDDELKTQRPSPQKVEAAAPSATAASMSLSSRYLL